MELKLGKGPALKDRRNIQMRNILRALPAIPDSFDVDVPLDGVTDDHTFNNLTFGDCVLACRAHHTLRFEKFEQGQLINITDQEVSNEYFKETGGPDVGLVMLNSLNAWRAGWTAAGKTYSIHAFGAIDTSNLAELKAVMFLFNGADTGLLLPRAAKSQFENHKTWEVVSGPDGEPGTWGGHALFLKRVEKALTKTNLTCITWGKEHEMTEDFFKVYCDEAYGIVDSLDKWMDPAHDPLDVEKLEGYLREIMGDQPLRITSTALPAGAVGLAYDGFLSASGGKPPYTWSVYSVPFPPGLELGPQTGEITGIPTAAGVYGVIFMCTDSEGGTTGVLLNITINAEPPAPPPGPTPSGCKWGNTTAAALQGVANVYPRLAGRNGRFEVKYLNPVKR